jgi:hypothetical protein
MSITILVPGCMAGVLSQTPVQPPPITYVGPPALECPDRHVQAGLPKNIAWWAIPSDTGAYTMYRVGGGNPYPCLADAPLPCEGTWGWDYLGKWFRSNVILGWWHGRRDQGGSGAYQTDGPGTNHGQGTLKGLFQNGKQ